MEQSVAVAVGTVRFGIAQNASFGQGRLTAAFYSAWSWPPNKAALLPSTSRVHHHRCPKQICIGTVLDRRQGPRPSHCNRVQQNPGGQRSINSQQSQPSCLCIGHHRGRWSRSSYISFKYSLSRSMPASYQVQYNSIVLIVRHKSVGQGGLGIVRHRARRVRLSSLQYAA